MTASKPILLTLPSLAPSLALEILPRGLTFHHFYAQVAGRTHDLIVGPEKPEDHKTQKYTNTSIGRYANRIPVGTHNLERGGYKATFSAQPNESPRVSLHGGPVGFDSLEWEVLSAENPPTLFTSAELSVLPESSSTSHAFFRLISPDGDQGYPGNLTTEVLVALLEPPKETQADGETKLGSLVYIYRAKVDKDVTPINITQHWGFNLEASLKSGPEALFVKDHDLTIKAEKTVKLDGDALNSGEFIPVASSKVHNHQHKKIGDGYPDKGYDDFYVLQKRSNQGPKRIPKGDLTEDANFVKDILSSSHAVSPVVELSSDKSGLKLTFDTNQNGVMFYSNGLSKVETGARKKIHGGSGEKGDGYAPGTAVFLEFHEVLTAFLDPLNKDKDDSLLTQDEIYHNFVRCDVIYREPSK